MLNLLQRGLERMYRIETELDVRDFVIDQKAREALGVARQPREQLLVAERDGDLELGLFVDRRALDNLTENDPRHRLDASNLGDFLLTVEGVSHFVYVVWRAQAGRSVSALELELQAEVDKYVTCLLTAWPTPPTDLRARLFERFELEPDLDDEERDRYLAANSNARAYAASLDSRFVARGSLGDMLDELRRFYRLGAAEKLSHIAQAA
jgi:hypothetical protein